jgi:hypothetical protein
MSKTAKIDYDHPRKQIITFFFRESIAHIAPSLYRKIDWDKGVEFLEQELHEIVKTRFRGAKICDKLAKVRLEKGK